MTIKTYLTSEEVSGMIDSASCLRDKALLTLLADCGCRVSELLSISQDNVDLEANKIIIPHLKHGVKKSCPQCGKIAGKNTKFCAKCGTDLRNITPQGINERTRIVSVGKDTSALLETYMDRANIEFGKPLFPISRIWVYKIVREAAEKIGLTGKCMKHPVTGKKHYVHPHDFRSALAVAWLDYAGSDVNKQQALQAHLGHSNFETTLRYNKLSEDAVANVGEEVRAARFGGK